MRHLVLIRTGKEVFIPRASAGGPSRVVPLLLDNIEAGQVVVGLTQFLEFRERDKAFNLPPIFESSLCVPDVFAQIYSVIHKEAWCGIAQVLGQEVVTNPALPKGTESVTVIDIPALTSGDAPKYCFFFISGGPSCVLNTPLNMEEYMEASYSDAIPLLDDDGKKRYALNLDFYKKSLEKNDVMTVDELCQILPSYMMTE